MCDRSQGEKPFEAIAGTRILTHSDRVEHHDSDTESSSSGNSQITDHLISEIPISMEEKPLTKGHQIRELLKRVRELEAVVSEQRAEIHSLYDERESLRDQLEVHESSVNVPVSEMISTVAKLNRRVADLERDNQRLTQKVLEAELQHQATRSATRFSALTMRPNINKKGGTCSGKSHHPTAEQPSSSSAAQPNNSSHPEAPGTTAMRYIHVDRSIPCRRAQIYRMMSEVKQSMKTRAITFSKVPPHMCPDF